MARLQGKGDDDGFGDEEAHGPLDRAEVVHTGDVVMIKCSLQEDPYAEASDLPGGTGYLTGDVIECVPKVVPVSSFAADGLDFRDFLFVVVDQLSYRALKDLRKRKKLLALMGGGAGTSLAVELRNLEERARQEHEENMHALRFGSHTVSLRYGDVVQLQHVRTGLYIGVRGKFSAEHQATSRRAELQDGTMASWLTVNPFFSHRTQGELVTFNEMVSLESVKLSEQWNLNWYKYTVPATGEEAFEVNCMKGGRGFYFLLYSRAVPVAVKSSSFALSFGLPLRMYSPHRKGCVAASCALEKKTVYMRSIRDESIKSKEFCAKDVWVIEPANHEFLKDTGIEYSVTPVLLRHLGSGYYLAISESDLADKSVSYNKDDLPGGKAPRKDPASPTTTYQEASRELAQDSEDTIASELVAEPSSACLFTLEMSSITMHQHEKMYISAQSPTVMIKWDRAAWPFWLSCLGHSKGAKGTSMMLEWTRTRSSRDALRLEVINDRFGLNAFDTVVYHRRMLRQNLWRITSNPRMSPAKWIHELQKAERAFSEIIFFLANSLNWQSGGDFFGMSSQKRHQDPLKEAWSANPQRQRFARELKYIDDTVKYFRAVAATMPEMQAQQVDFGMRLKGQATGGNFDAVAKGGDVETRAAKLKARVLKILVRLWLYCFLRNHTNENFFFQRGYMDIIDDMNGRGLGASDVFVALLSQNRELVRKVKSETVTRFISFIRVLGPLDTWLLFLKALCNPQNDGAISDKQQLVLSKMFFAGLLAPDAEKALVRRNREELMIAIHLEGPVGAPLGKGPGKDIKDCLGPELLAKGVHEVAISWNHPDTWQVGKVLYHGPEALNLPLLRASSHRKWVSLAQVAWVLQPEKLCQMLTGRTWEEVLKEEEQTDASDWQRPVLGRAHKSRDAGNPFDVSRIDLLRLLARYFQAQLQLVASLCKERQMNCIMALQEEYSYSVCLSGAADKRLPTIMRASFFDLLMALWVDRHPHYQVVLPRLMRFVRAGQAVLTLPVFRMSKESKPDCWTAEHAESLPKEVVAFYSLRSTEKLEGLVQAVCHYLTDPQVVHQVHSQEDDNKLTLAVVQTLQLLIRFGFLRSFETCAQLHSALLRILDGRTDWLDPPQVSQQRRSLTTASEGSPLLGDEAPKARVSMAPQTFDDSARRFLKCDENQSLVNAKVAEAEAILQLRSLGLDVQISQVLAEFQKFAQGQITLAAMVDAVISVMDQPAMPFAQPGLRSPNAMLIDLLMYEEAKLFPLALELLCGHCSFASDFLDELSKVSLLTEQQDALMQQLKSDVAQMSKILYSFENWGSQDDYGERDTKPLKELEEIGKRLQKACSGNSPASGRMVQDMLLHTDFVSVAGYWLMLDWQDTITENRMLHQRLTAIVCLVATAFCRKNPKNQGVFMDFLPGLSRVLDEDAFPECAGLVAEIFRENIQNCQMVPEALIEAFGALLVRSKRAGHFVPWYLFFFSSIVAVGSQGMSRNQVMVMECLQKNRAKNLMNCGLSLDRINTMIAKFNSTEMLKRPAPECWRQEDAELVFYASCLDLLVGMAKGRSLVNKPFVAELFSKIHCLALLCKVPTVESGPAAVVTRHLRTRWLQLLQLLLYDVDAALYEVSLMSSPSHMGFLDWLLTSLEALLCLNSSEKDAREPSVPQSFKGLDQEKEEYLAAMLNCIESFFNGPFQACLAKDMSAGEQLDTISKRYAKCFKVLERSHLRAKLPPGSAELLSIAAYRVLTAANLKADSATVEEVNTEVHVDEKAQEASSPEQVLWQQLLEALRTDRRAQERRRQQEFLLGQAFLTIYEESDPDYTDYTKNLSSSREMDFRRVGITVQDAIHRLVQHCEENLSDLPSLRRTLRILHAMLAVARGDWQREDLDLAKIQEEFARAGVSKLLVKVLNENPVDDVAQAAWNLLGELLKGTGVDGEPKLNKAVQLALHKAMSSSNDDTGMWDSFHQILTNAGNAAKLVHRFRTLPVLTAHEKAQLREFNQLLDQAVYAMEAARLLVEGHFKEMQDYLYSQEGNTRSFNVLQLCCWLLGRLCKDNHGINHASLSELKCVKCILTLLTELAQGPNLRNQEFLSHMGLIELVFKMLRENFEQLQKSEDDAYPAAARQLKAELMHTLLALLEGRMDTRVHQAVLQRSDPLVIRERIEFIYVYFILGAANISPGKVTHENLAAVPLGTPLHGLLLPQADPSEVYAAVKRNEGLTMELLEDMDDDQLGYLFREGFCLLELVLELSPHSTKFQNEVMPLPEEEDLFVDSESAYRTTRDYLRERAAFHKRQIYRQAFGCLRRFVKTIEVVLNGHIQSIHFQTPITAVWYVQGASKQRILDEVPFSLPDVKMKVFVQMCVELNNESRLILELSRFSLVPHKYRRWAQMYLPDHLHRPFWVFLSNDTRHMQNLLRASLYLSLCLALHAGLLLVPSKEKDVNDLTWASPMAQRISEILGALHLGCTLLWLCLYTCIKMPLNIRMVKHLYPKRSAIVNISAAWARYMSQRLLAWRCLLLIFTALAYFGRQWWVYSFLMADFFCLSSSLQTVLTGVVAPARPLFMTFLGAAIITFAYGAIGMHNFRQDFGSYCDQNIMVCAESILYMGTRAGIVGLSGMMDQVQPEDDTWFPRMGYDISYFVIFGVMLLNTIVALIVDSFQTQRREATAREHNLETQSFISCVDRKSIETVAQATGLVDGFEYHETYCQNKWDYMAFIFNLFEKNAQNYTGPESTIRHFIDNADVTWLPIGRTKMLEGLESTSKEDALTSIHNQNSKIIRALKQTQDNRKTLFKAIGSLARSMRDKTEGVQDQLSIILQEHSENSAVRRPAPPAKEAAAPAPEPPAPEMRPMVESRRRISMY